jgi:uncharacterized protein YciI
MFLLIASHIKPASEVAAQAEQHGTWVKKYLNEGVFLFAGPKKSTLGGVILTKSIDKELLNKILSEDSYIKEDVCEYQIIDFACKVAAPGLELLMN